MKLRVMRGMKLKLKYGSKCSFCASSSTTNLVKIDTTNIVHNGQIFSALKSIHVTNNTNRHRL